MKRFAQCLHTCLVLVFAVSLCEPVSAVTGPVSWWAAEGNASDLADSNQGTLENGASFAPGMLGQSFNFDGVNDHVAVPDATNLDFTTALTVEAWIYPVSISVSYPTIVGKWDAVAVNHRSYVFHLEPSRKVIFRVSPNGLELGFGVGTVISNSSVPLNQWTHVAGVYDSSSIKIYINGILDNQVAYIQGIFPGTNDLAIGAVIGGVAPGQSIAPFAGRIDEVRLYDCALTQGEVAQVFSTGNAGGCSLTVDIDIKPGSYPNSINLCSNGAVPIAILGSDVLDVSLIDEESLRFAEAAVKVVGKKDPGELCSFENINDDLFDDLVCHYVTSDIAALDGESSTATVNGELIDGTAFEGVDAVSIVKETCD